jgi:hypothetical protein
VACAFISAERRFWITSGLPTIRDLGRSVPLNTSTRGGVKLEQSEMVGILGLHSKEKRSKNRSQVFKDEVLPGTETTDQPAEEVSERRDHSRNHNGKVRIELCAKSFILQV